jgi:SNF2 family DNA or RNA helicase
MTFKVQPFKHQLKIFEMNRDRTEFAFFTEMGTGKSAMMVHTIAWLYLQGKIDRALIFAPKGCYRNWIDNELPAHMPDEVKWRAAYWSSYAKAKEKKDVEDLLSSDGPELKIFVVNVESLRVQRNPIKKSDSVLSCERFLKAGKCLCAVDESTCIKNPDSDRTKVVQWLGWKAQYRRILSGGPIPNGPLDIYSQSEFLKKGLLGFSSYYSFRNTFAVLVQQRLGSRSFTQVVGYKDEDDLRRRMSQWSIVISKKDCLDLPPKLYKVRDVELSKEQKEAYDKMRKDAIIELEAAGDMVTAPIVVTKLMKLHQIVCGDLKTDSGAIHSFQSVPRIDDLMEMLREADKTEGKSIVWANYQASVERLFARMNEEFGKGTTVLFYGPTSPDERQRAIRLLQDPESKVRRFLGNQQSGGMGNTLTAADKVFYFSNDYNLGTRNQSEDRNHRIGQKRPVTYVDFVARGTVDERILQVLKKKRDVNDKVLVSHWRWLLGLEE